MKQIFFSKYMGLALGAALLAACGPAGQDDQSAQQVDLDVQSSGPAVEEENASPEDVLATLQASIERAQGTQGDGAPALWTLKDEDTTVYLFGTVHILRPETEWRTPAFDAAFGSADKLVLEADTTSTESQQAMAALIPKYGLFSDGQTLNGVLEDEDEPAVEAALATLGIPLTAFQPMKPWLVSLQMSVLQMQKAGFDPESGIEPILTAEASATGKSFGYLETVEEQFSILADADMEEQVDGLIFTAQTLDFGPEMLDSLVTEWADGDVVGLGEIVAEPEAIGGEDAYQALLVNRNQNWVPQIKTMLDEPGTVFVAVGSAHLAGPDSVIKMLRADGLEISGPQ